MNGDIGEMAVVETTNWPPSATEQRLSRSATHAGFASYGFRWRVQRRRVMDLQAPAPDIILLATEWQPRALLRAQLIEEGFDVLATNSWPVMRRWLRPGAKPSLVIVDLQGLPQPERVLNDLKLLMRPARVLVLTSIGNVTPHTIEAQGFQAAKRPIRIDTVVAIATRILRSQTDSDAGRDSAEQSNS